MASLSLDDFLERIECAARTGGASELDLATLRQAVAYRHTFETLGQAWRVYELERVLSDRDPAERREIICERTGISRTTYFRLRAMLSSPAPDGTA